MQCSQMKVVTCIFCFLACTDLGSVASYSHFHSPSLPLQRFHALATINQTLLHTRTSSIETSHSRYHSLDIIEGEDDTNSYPYNTDTGCALSRASSCKSLPTENQSWISDHASSSVALTDYPMTDHASSSVALTDYPSSESQVVFSYFFWLSMVVLVTASYVKDMVCISNELLVRSADLLGFNFVSFICFEQKTYFCMGFNLYVK
jgi:hypothetical protein